MINAKGHGQSECFLCKSKGIFSLTWTCFLFKIDNDEHLYCRDCARELERRNNERD